MISEKSSSAQFNKHELLTTFFQLPENIYLEMNWDWTTRTALFSSAAAYELNTETPQSY